MFKVLHDTGLEATLPQNVFDTFCNEIQKTLDDFENSKKDLKIFKNISAGTLGKRPSSKPDMYIQSQYPHMVYDYRICKEVSEINGSYLTMAEDGNLPCSLLTIFKFYNIKTSLIELGSLLAENGYCHPKQAVQWLAVEKISAYYKLLPCLESNFINMLEKIGSNTPVLAQVSKKWLYHLPDSEEYEFIIIWRVENNTVYCGTTTSPELVEKPVSEVIHATRAAWTFSKRL